MPEGPEFCAPRAEPPTFETWVFLLVIFGAYVAAVRRRPPARSRWSCWRTSSFAVGLLLIGVAVLPALPGAGNSAIRHHMISHVLLAMLTPIAIVFGSPTTLLLQALPRRAARTAVSLLRSGPCRAISRPTTALVANVGTMFILYLTPLYSSIHGRGAASTLLHVHFFLAGVLFAWVIAGAERVGARPSFTGRLAALLISAAAHAYLAKVMYAKALPRGTGETSEQVQIAAQIMYYGGDLAELVLAAALFSQWYHARSRLRSEAAPTLRPAAAVAAKP